MEKLEDLMHVDKNLLPLKQTGLSQPIGFAQTNFKGAGTVGDPHTMVEAGDDPQKSKLSDPPKPWLPTEVQLFIRALENTGFEDMPTRFRAFDQVQKKWLPTKQLAQLQNKLRLLRRQKCSEPNAVHRMMRRYKARQARTEAETEALRMHAREVARIDTTFAVRLLHSRWMQASMHMARQSQLKQMYAARGWPVRTYHSAPRGERRPKVPQAVPSETAD